jgi:hypothetical protein
MDKGERMNTQPWMFDDSEYLADNMRVGYKVLKREKDKLVSCLSREIVIYPVNSFVVANISGTPLMVFSELEPAKRFSESYCDIFSIYICDYLPLDKQGTIALNTSEVIEIDHYEEILKMFWTDRIEFYIRFVDLNLDTIQCPKGTVFASSVRILKEIHIKD